MSIEIHKEHGKPSSVTMSYDAYQALLNNQEAFEDIASAQAIMARVSDGEGTIPNEVMKAELEGLHPIKAWRMYRGLTQQQLVNKIPEEARIGRAFLAEIESGEKEGTLLTRQLIAEALVVDLYMVVSRI